MNTEEKAKAYEMALEAARKELGVDRKEWEVVQQVLCNIFPELAESEDERIRNCIRCLTSLDQAQDVIADMGFTRQDLLDYLEKQKECLADNSETSADDDERIRKGLLRHFRNKTKPYWNEIAVKDIIVYLEKQKDLDKMIVVSPEVWDNAISEAYENGKKEGEKQKEQKLISFNKHYNPDDYEVVIEGNATSLKQKEQKPVPINPDDMHMLERTMELFEFCNDKEMIWNWLCEKVKAAAQKSAECIPDSVKFEEGFKTGRELGFREGVASVKPAEWGEEDEKMLKWLCRIIHSRVVNKELSLAEESELGKWIDKWIDYASQHEKTWDEFDRDCLKRAIWYVENPAPTVVKDTNLVLWLQSLPERFNLQPKEEWSEEDEENFKWFDKFFRAESVIAGGRDIPQDKYLWFKSLRPQPKQEWTEDDKDKVIEYLHGKDGGMLWSKAKEITEEILAILRPQSKAELTLLDENIIKAAVAFVEQNDHFNCWGGIDKHTVIKALRSLKSHWKPSE